MQPTPASALGAYETTPFAIAEAYTIFANHGVRVTPTTLALVKSASGKVLYRGHPENRMVLDPRVAFQVNNMLQQVLQSGTGTYAAAHGFSLPAAGKTGSTHDGWFAGFTNKLLCVVWVGYDDGRDLHIDGADSALPIWTDFMRQAAAFDRYRNPEPFTPPPGVVSVRICATSGQLAGPYCPRSETAAFISGTEPKTICRTHGAPPPRVIVSRAEESPEPPQETTPAPPPPPPAAPPAPVMAPPPAQAPPPAVVPQQPAPKPVAPAQPPPTAPVQPPNQVPPVPPKTSPLPATDVPDPSSQPPPDSQ
jgi:penicillin-binding protein 1B